MLLPNKQAPSLRLTSTLGKDYDIQNLKPEKFSMIVFYRGYHCPVCKNYLQELNSKVEKFKEIGVNEIWAVSGDSKERAAKSAKEWHIDQFPVLYGQNIQSMQDWGLYISTAIKDTEPDIFGEPGLFLIDSNNTIFYIALNSMPFARPQFEDIQKAVKFVTENDYPSRGRGI